MSLELQQRYGTALEALRKKSASQFTMAELYFILEHLKCSADLGGGGNFVVETKEDLEDVAEMVAALEQLAQR